MANAKPFIKWAGGKGQLLDTIQEFYPLELGKTITKYVEPFIGGGAVLFDILNKYGSKLDEVYISDINAELIDTYKVIKEEPDELIKELKILENQHLPIDKEGRKKIYDSNRSTYNKEKKKENRDKILIASHFIYLNKTCFNGLYRVNSRGSFNVPMGDIKNPTICDEKNIKAVSKKLQNVTIERASYRESKKYIDSNTFVYFDPPYRPLTTSSSFKSYTEVDFNDECQEDLAKYVKELTQIGAKVALSNSDPKNVNPDDDYFDNLYNFANVYRVQATRMINSKSSGRGMINEILVTNYPKPEKKKLTTSILEKFN